MACILGSGCRVSGGIKSVENHTHMSASITVDGLQEYNPGGDRVHKLWCWVELSITLGVVIELHAHALLQGFTFRLMPG
jgi:hypothetical protein